MSQAEDNFFINAIFLAREIKKQVVLRTTKFQKTLASVDILVKLITQQTLLCLIVMTFISLSIVQKNK